MADRTGVEIDYCTVCRGVWLDRGELDKIIERSAPSSQAFRAHRDDDDHDDYEDRQRKRKKSKNFFGDLFDF